MSYQPKDLHKTETPPIGDLERILSEEYMDLVARQSIDTDLISQAQENHTLLEISAEFKSIYLPSTLSIQLNLNELSYSLVPACYSLLDQNSLAPSPSSSIQSPQVMNLSGSGVLIGFVDTGIDYRNDIFRTADGSTRILGIWDQTDQTGSPPQDLLYGSYYNETAINQALQSDSPLDIVPHQDINGHGTYLASVAAGNDRTYTTFRGIAPQSAIAVVKLKEAKQLYKNFYNIASDKQVFQENDIMLGVRFLHFLAMQYDLPLVICLGLGTNTGDHTGYAPFSSYINTLATGGRRAIVTGAGSEALQGHHYEGRIANEGDKETVEINVSPNNPGFSMELWGHPLNIFSVALRTPLGETIQNLPPREGGQRFSFILENTRIYIDYQRTEGFEGSELVFFRFFDPTPGLWTFEITGNYIINGTFDMWLPMTEFLSSPAYFLQPQPDCTLTEPSCPVNVITVGCCNDVMTSMNTDSGRGNTRSGNRKPDFAAPGINLYGVLPDNRFGTMTGTSASAAYTAGTVALLMEWGIVRRNQMGMNTTEVKNILIYGASSTGDSYSHDKHWGYGPINLAKSFERLQQ